MSIIYLLFILKFVLDNNNEGWVMRSVAHRFFSAAVMILVGCSSSGAWAQMVDTRPMPVITAIAKPVIAGELPLYPGGSPALPGAAKSEAWSAIEGNKLVSNVSQATITPFLPSSDKATGAAVLVAPGGGFVSLAIDIEGYQVARWLADHGVAAFVLKYRLVPTPTDPAARRAFDADRARQLTSLKDAATALPPFQPAVDDGTAAMRFIRAGAGKWGIDPNRVGMIGFSAGAITTLAVTLAQMEGSKPSFAGIIYGPMNAVSPPPGAPPVFIALAADDPLFGMMGSGLFQSWRVAGHPAELHIYQAGGHGFGMLDVKTTATSWPEQFLDWLKMNHMLGTQGRR
jgi:acetyl esterase/lipase